jgi:hypothetical protein
MHPKKRSLSKSISAGIFHYGQEKKCAGIITLPGKTCIAFNRLLPWGNGVRR